MAWWPAFYIRWKFFFSSSLQVAPAGATVCDATVDLYRQSTVG